MAENNSNTNTNTQIREAENKVKIEGILKEIRLEEKEDIISGDVIILVGENSEIAVSVYVGKTTKSGGENKAYSGIQTVMEEYVSIAALMKEGKPYAEAFAEATKVRINKAKLDKQEFYANGGEFVSNPRVSSNFFNRIIDDAFSPRAEFDIECYFEKIRKEIKGSEETGRIIIDAIIPLYGGKVVPMEFVAEGEVADYIESNYSPRKTGQVWGDVVNIVERTVVKKSGFGKDKEETVVNYKRELLITGGNEEQYSEENPKAYTLEQIKQAWKIRETETLPALLKKSQDNSKGRGMGAPRGAAGSATANSTQQQKSGAAPAFKF